MEEEQFDIICKKMDKIVALLSVLNLEDKDKKILILRRAGLTSKEIGDLLGLEESTIRSSKGWKVK